MNVSRVSVSLLAWPHIQGNQPSEKIPSLPKATGRPQVNFGGQNNRRDLSLGPVRLTQVIAMNHGYRATPIPLLNSTVPKLKITRLAPAPFAVNALAI